MEVRQCEAGTRLIVLQLEFEKRGFNRLGKDLEIAVTRLSLDTARGGNVKPMNLKQTLLYTYTSRTCDDFKAKVQFDLSCCVVELMTCVCQKQDDHEC